MISRIYIAPKGKDSRGILHQKSFNKLDINGKVAHVSLVDSYTIDAKLSSDELAKSAITLTNPVIETHSINTLPGIGDFSFVCEIGFLPGVTDNVGQTAKEEISDCIGRALGANEAVYTSRLFFVSGNVTESDMKKIALSLHNPLIERFGITEAGIVKKNNSLPLIVPQVILPKKIPVINVPLNVSDDELIKIGKEGIQDRDGLSAQAGSRRGPLALDLSSMKIIQKHFRD